MSDATGSPFTSISRSVDLRLAGARSRKTSMIEFLARLIMSFVDSVSDVDDRPIARKVTLGCLLTGAILLCLTSVFCWQRK